MSPEASPSPPPSPSLPSRSLTEAGSTIRLLQKLRRAPSKPLSSLSSSTAQWTREDSSNTTIRMPTDYLHHHDDDVVGGVAGGVAGGVGDVVAGIAGGVGGRARIPAQRKVAGGRRRKGKARAPPAPSRERAGLQRVRQGRGEEGVAGGSLYYTFYTYDDDLRAAGSSIASYNKLSRGSGEKRRVLSRQLLSPENIDLRKSRFKDARVVSEVYQKLVLQPNHFHELELAQQWLLERCGPDPGAVAGGAGDKKQWRWKLEGERKAARGASYVWPVAKRLGDGVAWPYREATPYGRSWPVVSAAVDEDESSVMTRREDGVAGSCYPWLLGSAEQSIIGEGRVGERPGMVHRPYSPLFEWSQVYPILQEDQTLMVDKSHPGFQSRSHVPLPPINNNNNNNIVTGVASQQGINKVARHPVVMTTKVHTTTTNSICIQLPQLERYRHCSSTLHASTH